MESIELKIAFGEHKAGDVVEMEDRIAKHFLAKGWGVVTFTLPVDVPKPKKRKK